MRHFVRVIIIALLAASLGACAEQSAKPSATPLNANDLQVVAFQATDVMLAIRKLGLYQSVEIPAGWQSRVRVANCQYPPWCQTKPSPESPEFMVQLTAPYRADQSMVPTGDVAVAFMAHGSKHPGWKVWCWNDKPTWYKSAKPDFPQLAIKFANSDPSSADKEQYAVDDGNVWWCKTVE